MIEYRKLPHGTENISTIGLGLGIVAATPPAEIEQIVKKAVDNGINFFDAGCGAQYVYAPLGRALQGRRDKVYLQVHFGAVYNEKGEYGWSRNLEQIKKTFDWELAALRTDYVDFGFLHCVDAEDDLQALLANGVVAFVQELQDRGVVRHIGFSSHTPAVAHKLLDLGIADIMMFSSNAAYDFEQGDEYAIGSAAERAALYRRCAREGVGISVMKPFHGGQLLDAAQSPFGAALTTCQCLQYVLERPGVLCAVPGITSLAQLDELLGFFTASSAAKDYSVISTFSAETVRGTCVYCNHCEPCPAGIDIGLVNKYYDLARVGDQLAAGHYDKLTVKADSCLACGHCDSRCPFGVRQSERMREIAAYFK